jgi:beta-mannanase
MVTWEPWEPTPLGSSAEEQGRVQSRWSNESILRGEHNSYIDMIARDFRDCGLETVYLRWGHEMNGGWYPWSHTPTSYVAAWKYLRHRIRSQRGAWNVQMVWAPNPDLWRRVPADWLSRLLPFWPGYSSVDSVGFTMIERGPESGQDYPVSEFAKRTWLARNVFGRPVLAAEVNVVRELAVDWLNDMAVWVRNKHPYPAFVLSQGPSRAEAAGTAGDLSWSAMNYPAGRDAIARLASALHDE